MTAPQPAAERAPARAASWRSWAALMRFRYHLSFAVVLLGLFTVTRNITPALAARAAALYLSFNVLLYGGIYTINGIADAPSDRLHPRKRLRPVASGAVPAARAWRFAALLIAAGFWSAWALLPPEILPVYAAVLAVNFLYTFAAKGIPYVEIVFNGATYPLRYLMGGLLAGSVVSPHLMLLVFLVAIGASTLRRRVENARAYTPGALLALEIVMFGAIGALRLADPVNHSVFYIVAAATYAALVFGVDAVPPARRAFARLWSA